MDHFLSFIRPTHRTRRWPTKLFYHMLTMVLHNARVLYNKANPGSKKGLRKYAEEVATALNAKFFKPAATVNV